MAARSIIVQRVESSPSTLREIHADAASQNPALARKARLALRFLEEWGDATAYDAYDDMPAYDDQYPADDELMSGDDLREMAMEMLRRRPGLAGATVGDRLTSLADELGLGGDGVDYEALLGNVRILGSNAALDEDEEFEGHAVNARQLGVDNFAGLSASRWASEEGRSQESVTQRRRARREAMVIQDDTEVDEGEEDSESGQQRGWWVV